MSHRKHTILIVPESPHLLVFIFFHQWRVPPRHVVSGAASKEVALPLAEHVDHRQLAASVLTHFV